MTTSNLFKVTTEVKNFGSLKNTEDQFIAAESYAYVERLFPEALSIERLTTRMLIAEKKDFKL
jgi:hypothetical protein